LEEGAEESFEAAERAFVNILREGARLSPVAEAIGVVFRVAANLGMSVAVLSDIGWCACHGDKRKPEEHEDQNDLARSAGCVNF
jgi:hypothetical protein